MHETQPFGVDFGVKKIDPRRVATGPREAGNQPERHRVLAYTEHNRDGRRSGFGGKRARGGVGGRRDHRDMAADCIVEDCGNLLVSTVQPVILDNDVVAFRKPCLAQAFAKLGGKRGGRVSLSGIDERDDRHVRHRLLRVRRERPCSHGTPSKRKEFPSPHGSPSRQVTAYRIVT